MWPLVSHDGATPGSRRHHNPDSPDMCLSHGLCVLGPGPRQMTRQMRAMTLVARLHGWRAAADTLACRPSRFCGCHRAADPTSWAGRSRLGTTAPLACCGHLQPS
jgi:hypothetical protein